VWNPQKKKKESGGLIGRNEKGKKTFGIGGGGGGGKNKSAQTKGITGKETEWDSRPVSRSLLHRKTSSFLLEEKTICRGWTQTGGEGCKTVGEATKNQFTQQNEGRKMSQSNEKKHPIKPLGD